VETIARAGLVWKWRRFDEFSEPTLLIEECGATVVALDREHNP
jgi:hypothetical protein